MERAGEEDFAAKQNSSAETFLAASATPTVRPEPVEGVSLSAPISGKEETASTGSARTDEEAVEAGMAEMSEKFCQKGGGIYLPAAE